MKRNNIGVDIGLYSLKCAVLEKVKDSYVLKHKETYRITKKEQRMNSEFIKESIIDFTKKYKIRRANLYFSIPFMSPEVQFRFFDMPILPEKELAKGIRYKIEGAILSDFDSIFYKWSVIPKDEEDCRVLAVSVYQALVNEIKKIKKRGWRTISIEPQIVSLGRLAKKDSAVIDFGHRGTRLMVFRDGFPVYIDTIDLGGKDFTEAISRRYPEQAESVKHEFGAVIPDKSIETNPNVLAIADLVLDVARDLSMQLKQSLRIAEVEQGIEFNEIYYIGNGAKLRYLIDYLSSETGYDLMPLNLTSNDEYPYAVASGASLGGDYLKDINFVKAAPKKKHDPMKTLFVVVGAILAMQAGLYYLNIETNKRFDGVISKNEVVRSEIMNTENEIRINEEEIQKYREIEIALTRIQGRRTVNSDILFEFPKRLPENISLREVSISAGEMTFRGDYETYSDVGVFAIALEEIGDVDIETLGENEFMIKFRPNPYLSEFIIEEPEETK